MDKAPILIREAGQGDLPTVLALHREAGFAGGSLDSEEAGRLLERFALYPDYRLYVAETDGQILGTFSLLIMDLLGPQPEAIVESVSVAPSTRGSGIGSALMREAMRLAEAKNCCKLVLSSNIKRTEAHAFYERLGFRPYGYALFVEFGKAGA